jgi:hypothetical protein
MNLLRNLLMATRRIQLEQERNANKQKPFYTMVNVRQLENKMLVAEFDICLN